MPTREPYERTGPLLLLDGMSLAFRAYYALPDTLATTDGLVTNAVHGFASMLVYLIREHRPASLAVAFDHPGETFRDDMVPDYKAGRAETPSLLPPQFDMIREVMASLAIPVVEAEGFEADDVIATLATEAAARACDVVIVTGDRDSFQLVADPYVRVLYNKRGVSDYSLYDEAGILERTGVPPSQYVLLAALRGDPSDNLPGVPGVGEKTAAKLLTTYEDLDGIFEHLADLSPKLRENLTEHEELVRSNARVIPLITDVPLDVDVEYLTLGGWDWGNARTTFAHYEMKTVWDRLEELLQAGALGHPVEGSEPP
ncbi:MAG TPA: 5'-3' exonuclease H3TH domain-containing protein, partial [Acidimicrobiales bacterium]